MSYNKADALQLNGLNVSESTQSFEYNSPTFWRYWTVGFTLSQLEQDLSNRNVVLSNSTEIPLSSLDSGRRQTLDSRLGYNVGAHAITLNYNQDLERSLFSTRAFGISDTIQIYSGATQLKVSLQQSTQNQPLSYYIDPASLQSRERLTRIETSLMTVGVEQIWSEIYKTNTEVQYQVTKKFRPATTSLRLSQAVALNDFWTVRSQLGAATESREEDLYDDRGYFQSRWLDADLTYEWKLDSFLSLGWSTLDEVENDPRRDRVVTLGTDELSLSVKQALKLLSYDLGFSYFVNSDKKTATAYRGALIWNY